MEAKNTLRELQVEELNEIFGGNAPVRQIAIIVNSTNPPPIYQFDSRITVVVNSQVVVDKPLGPFT
jgi:hypothetical protein